MLKGITLNDNTGIRVLLTYLIMYIICIR